MATPFVEGRLRGERVSVEIESECGHCGRALHLTVDSDLRWTVRERDADPLLFEPEVDWQRFTEPNILHAY